MERLCKSMPGGDTRSSVWFGPYPLVIDHCAGQYMWDVDGNRYLDFLNNYSELVHGHAPAFVVGALRQHLDRGWVFAAPMAEQGDLAELLTARLPSADTVRFTNSGTEATMLAARIARGYTKRQRIAVAEHSYHGSSDELDWARAALNGVAVFPPSDADAARVALDDAGPLAAIFMEPVLGAGGIIPIEPAFLAFLRDYASSTGAVLVFDEAHSLRVHVGGRQSAVDVTPDLTALAKSIGGGLPIGGVAGREEVMAVTNPQHEAYVEHAGTNNGNRLAMVAGAAALRAFDAEAIARINGLADRFVFGVCEAAAEHPDVPVSMTQCGSLFNMHAACDVASPEQAKTVDPILRRYLHLAMLNRGVFFAERGFMDLSTAMDEADIDTAVAAFSDALDAA